jgi:signal transduction histidine kinase
VRLAAIGSARDAALVVERKTADGEYQQLTSDLLHDLSQPLSTLTCLLEVNLLLSRPLKQVRHDLKIALQQMHWIVRLFRGLRELTEAGNWGQEDERVALASCLRDVVAQLSPMATPSRVELSVSSGSECAVNFQVGRLRQALVHLIEFALSSAAIDGAVAITVDEEGEGVRLTIVVSPTVSTSVELAPDNRVERTTAESQEEKQRQWNRRLGLAIARRIFEAGGAETAGASFKMEASGDRLQLEVCFPMASCSR